MRKLQNRTWAIFAVFSIAVIGLAWGFQALAFSRLYYRQELERIGELGNTISEQWKHVRFSQPVSIRFYEDEIPVRIFNRAGAKTVDEIEASQDPDPLGPWQFIVKYEAAGKDVYINTERDEHPDTEFIVYGRRLDNPVNPDSSLYVYIVDPLGSLHSVRILLRQQLLLIGVISILLAVILSYFMAFSVAKPIVDLTEKAGRLAQGDYSVRFSRYNIEEIQKLSDTLNDATEKLARIDETKNNLLASVSHDLRTPLTMIKAYAEMIRDLSWSNEEKRNEHIRIILEESDWMSALITDILEYARIRSGTMAYEMRVMDLAGLTDICADRFRDATVQHSKNIAIDWENPGYRPVWGDINRIQRVMNNLLDNAVKFSEDNSVIHIRISQTEEGNTVWEVRDHGPGIAPENLESIWDMYFTRDKSEPRKSGGTGLGLSIARGILAAHGAKYGVRSTPGEGSVFWFSMKTEKER
ncbi:MAG: HAMP domain-containing histidine kinase [Lachnospiraceae bacterium]|nr:HAMP domain-containing histidine kinase [Lachnospiraceae bacterium]